MPTDICCEPAGLVYSRKCSHYAFQLLKPAMHNDNRNIKTSTDLCSDTEKNHSPTTRLPEPGISSDYMYRI